jgi:anti-sigma B factor antagonist
MPDDHPVRIRVGGRVVGLSYVRLTPAPFDPILDAAIMSTPSAKLLVFVSGQLACVKIVGRANFTSSIDFKTVLTELFDKGYTCFILDLAECVLMDSTFLGVLAGFGLKLTALRNGAEQNSRGIELVNPNGRISELLENLGVIHLFKVVSGPLALPAEVQAHSPAPTSEPSREQVSRNCLEAHKTLMEIAPSNIPKFKEVTQFLAEDLKKKVPG